MLFRNSVDEAFSKGKMNKPVLQCTFFFKYTVSQVYISIFTFLFDRFLPKVKNFLCIIFIYIIFLSIDGFHSDVIES